MSTINEQVEEGLTESGRVTREERPVHLLTDLFPAADLLDAPSGSAGSLQELERAFFDCLRLKNGVYKTTWAHRMDDLNAQVMSHLPSARPLQVLDVAISSGVSTLEWVESLEQSQLEFRMTGMDLTINGFLVSFGDRLHAVLDESKWPLLFEIDGQWLSSPPRKRDIPRHLFSLAAIKCALFLWARKYRESEGGRVLRILGMPTSTRAINLVTPRLTAHPLVSVSKGDVMAEDSLRGSFHVIRAANILNKDYFDDRTLTKVVMNLRRRLTPNGILVVCHTDDSGRNRATIFQLGGDARFAALSRMNGGSEIEDLILQVPVV